MNLKDKRNILYNFYEDIYKSFYLDDKNTTYKLKDLGPNYSIASYIDLIKKDYPKSDYDLQDLVMILPSQPNKVQLLHQDKIEDLYKAYKIAKINSKYPMVGKIIGYFINPILYKYWRIKCYLN